MALRRGDFVTITCEIPYGLWKNKAPKVKENVGIITEVSYYDDDDNNEPEYEVKDAKGNIFVYAPYELTTASASDIANALRELLKRR